jgi:hypothetical protein
MWKKKACIWIPASHLPSKITTTALLQWSLFYDSRVFLQVPIAAFPPSDLRVTTES